MLCKICRAGHSLFFFRFALHSALFFLPRIAIALAFILQIFRFAHRSIALKKTAVRSWKRALKRKIAPKTTAVCSLKIRALTPPPPPPSVNKICMYRVKELPPGAGRGGGSPPSPLPGGIFFRQFKYTQPKICTNHAF